jgi:hypothetical protein
LTEFYLLTKAQCPLCDHALAQLQQLPLQRAIRLHQVDIATDEQLCREYAWLVPVLVRAADDAELRWPFGDELMEFLNA